MLKTLIKLCGFEKNPPTKKEMIMTALVFIGYFYFFGFPQL